MTETRDFKMHPQLLMDVIQKQAGSLTKAIMEGAMNAVDAGAKQFAVTVSETEVMMEDDGAGFASRKEIENFFEVFGQPHEEEDAHYGQFRMGRGQIFSYGHNIWRTGKWAMEVDVKNRGLSYDLKEKKRNAKGCKIVVRLYEPLNRREIRRTLDDLRRALRYLEIPATWRADKEVEQISKPPKDESWDYEDENCWARFEDKGTMDIYNRGVYVRGIPKWAFGTGGVVISKQRLDVNFARNDIQSSCKVWKKIKKAVDQRSRDNIQSKALDDAARSCLAASLYDGDIDWSQIRKQRVITNCCGKHITPASLLQKSHRTVLSVAIRGDRIGDRIMQSKMAYVVATETLTRFHCSTLEELLDLFVERGAGDVGAEIRELDDLREQLVETCTVLKPSELLPTERVWVKIAGRFPQGLQAFRGYMSLEEIKENNLDTWRDIRVGIGQGRAAWTDGRSYIVLERSYLKTLEYWKPGGIADLGHTMLHELCHTDDDQDSSDHGPEFYERYHDLRNLHSQFMQRAMAHIEQDVCSVLKKAGRKLIGTLDKVEIAEKKSVDVAALTRCLKGNGSKFLPDFSELEARLASEKSEKSKKRKTADTGFLEEGANHA